MLQFFRRHRNKFTGLACAVGASYAAFRYAQYKLQEFQENSQLDQLAKENIKLRFDRNMQDCMLCLISDLPLLQEILFQALPVESITAKLNQQRKVKGVDGTDDVALRKQEKRALFEEMKIASVTRAFAAVYLVNLLASLLYVQMNLVGRQVYINSTASVTEGLSSAKNTCETRIEGKFDLGVSPNVDRMYLCLSYFLLNTGWRCIVTKLEAVVKDVFGSLRLSKAISVEEWAELVESVRKSMEEFPLDKVILPEPGKELELVSSCAKMKPSEEEQGILAKLFDETRDLVESADFKLVIWSMLDQSTDQVTASIKKELYHLHPPSAAAPKLEEVPVDQVLPARVPLPSFFPILTRQANLLTSSVNNSYLDNIQCNTQLQAFSAIIFSSFSAER